MVLTLEQAKKIKQDYSYIHNEADTFLVIAPNDEKINEFIKYANEQIRYGDDPNDSVWSSSTDRYTLVVLIYNRIDKFGFWRLNEWLKSQGEDFDYEKYGIERE